MYALLAHEFVIDITVLHDIAMVYILMSSTFDLTLSSRS